MGAQMGSIPKSNPSSAPKTKPIPVQHTLGEEITIRSIKLLDIGWATAFYFVSALIFVKIFTMIAGSYNEKKESAKSTARIIFEVILHVWLIGAMAYVIRNLFELIPWPFEGVYGYVHLRVKEVTNSAVFVAFTVVFDTILQQKVLLLKQRLVAA